MTQSLDASEQSSEFYNSFLKSLKISPFVTLLSNTEPIQGCWKQHKYFCLFGAVNSEIGEQSDSCKDSFGTIFFWSVHEKHPLHHLYSSIVSRLKQV